MAWFKKRGKADSTAGRTMNAPSDGVGAFLFERRAWILSLSGVVLLFGSVVWELIYHRNNHESIFQISWLFSDDVWIALLREFGFAALIALILTLVVERSSHEKQIAQANKHHQEIAQNVFHGVFSTFVPQAVVEEATQTILRSSLIRTYHHLNFILSNETADEGKRPYSRLEVTTSYSVKNISNSPLDVPVRLSFSTPADHLLKPMAKLNNVWIGGPQLNAAEIAEGVQPIGNNEPVASYRWNRILRPSESLDVRFNYVLAKERSDNEIWVSLLSVLDFKLDLTLNCDDLEFGANAFHRLALDKVVGAGTRGYHQWALSAPILPNQGLVFWWRPRDTPPVPPVRQDVAKPMLRHTASDGTNTPA